MDNITKFQSAEEIERENMRRLKNDVLDVIKEMRSNPIKKRSLVYPIIITIQMGNQILIVKENDSLK